MDDPVPDGAGHMTSTEHIRTAVLLAIATTVAFAQMYSTYRSYKLRPETSRATLLALQICLASIVALAVFGVTSNILGALGVVRF